MASQGPNEFSMAPTTKFDTTLSVVIYCFEKFLADGTTLDNQLTKSRDISRHLES